MVGGGGPVGQSVREQMKNMTIHSTPVGARARGGARQARGQSGSGQQGGSLSPNRNMRDNFKFA